MNNRLIILIAFALITGLSACAPKEDTKPEEQQTQEPPVEVEQPQEVEQLQEIEEQPEQAGPTIEETETQEPEEVQEEKVPEVKPEVKEEPESQLTTSGVDEDGFPLNAKGGTRVVKDGVEYEYNSTFKIWGEVGKTEVTIWDNDGEEYLNSPQI